MDHDQEKFYQDEEQESRPESQPETGREVNDMTYFLELMKHLRTLIERGSRIPLSGKVLIDADKCLMILDELDGNLPDAIQYGMQMYSEKDRILGTASNEAISRVTSAEMKANKALENARRDAERIVFDAEEEAKAILEDANERAEHMISESEIVLQAKEEARIIRNDAKVDANETKLKASHDAYRFVADIEGNVEEVLKQIHRLTENMAKNGE